MTTTKVETLLTAVVEADFHMGVLQIVHVDKRQTTYYHHGRRVPMQKHTGLNVMYGASRRDGLLVIADKE